jgi:hypothetical protein
LSRTHPRAASLVRAEGGRRSLCRITRAPGGVLATQIEPGLTVIKNVSDKAHQPKGRHPA